MEDPAEQINQIKSDYESKISNLKTVLSKAKLAYDQQKTLYTEKCSELEAARNQIQDLESIVQKYLYNQVGNSDSKLDVSSIRRVCARIAIDSVTWICFKTDTKIVYILFLG